ncbi:accessory Sec system protein Asp3 [Leuconostoc mesenteroides]
MQYQIYWTPNTELLGLQGATVDFRSLNEVYYENYFLPSGEVVTRWHSAYNVMNGHPVAKADLPQLSHDETYVIERHIDASDRMFAYLVVTFFDQQYQPIATFSENTEKLLINTPSEYAFYVIDLVSAGSGHFTFHNFDIRVKKAGILRETDQEIAPQLYTYLHQPKKVTSKVLRVIFSEPEEAVTDYVTQKIKTTQQAVLFVASGALKAGYYRQLALISAIKNARKQTKSHSLEFIGYGPISSYAALYYQQQIKKSVAIISEDILLSPEKSEWAIERSVDGVNYLTSSILPNTQLDPIIPHPKYERLETLTYETPTPEEYEQQLLYEAEHPKPGAFAKFFGQKSK